MTDIETLAKRHLPGDYTIERLEFMDGDTRTKAKHNAGWSATNFVQWTLWQDFGEIWIDYYENDRRLTRNIHSYELSERVV